MGIRGPYWEGRERAGRRRSYSTGASRDGSVSVSDAFFGLLRDETCAYWLDHLRDQDDPCGHTRELPPWIARLPKSVDFGRLRDFDRLRRSGTAAPVCRTCGHKTIRRESGWWCTCCHRTREPHVARDAAARVAAAVLGVSVRSVYRGSAGG
jgi:hypothetical protein